MPSRRRKLRVAVVFNHDPGARADVTDVEAAVTDVEVALRSRGHDVQLLALDGSMDGLSAMARMHADVVFNLVEALRGQSHHEPVVPHLCELLGLPYTGSRPLGLSLALRKDLARTLLGAAGVPVPKGVALTVPRRPLSLRFPRIVKLAAEDASVGIDRGSVVGDEDACAARVAALLESHAGPVLVEEFIPGREIYVSLVGAPLEPLPPHEIDFSDMPESCPPIVTWEGKWLEGSPEHAGSRPMTAKVGAKLLRTLEQLALHSADALGLSGYARVDFRVDGEVPYVIDVNPNCDLSAGAGMARAAKLGGWTHAELIERICVAALPSAPKERS